MSTEKRTPIVGQGEKGDRHPPGIGREWTQKAPERPKTPGAGKEAYLAHGRRKSTADGLAGDDPPVE